MSDQPNSLPPCAQGRPTVILPFSMKVMHADGNPDDEGIYHYVGTPCFGPACRCPACGGPVLHVQNRGGYVTCTSDGCHACGPDSDPDGSKWKKMCVALMIEERLARNVVLLPSYKLRTGQETTVWTDTKAVWVYDRCRILCLLGTESRATFRVVRRWWGALRWECVR